MKIVSAAEMREIDRATSERFGVPSLTLMENAGGAVAEFALERYPSAKTIGVVCGKGNNGGDGFVAARRLAQAGCKVRVLLLADPGDLRGDAAEMFARMGIPAVVARTTSELESREAAEVFASDLLIDAILGTGFRPPVSDLYAAAIARLNQSKTPKLAVDIPSGANADAHAMGDGPRVKANAVVTFTAPRPAHAFAPLAAGSTVIVPIGSPEEAIESQLQLNLITSQDILINFASRRAESNKGNYGDVLVIGGSFGKSGAAAMAGIAALRSGAGLSTVATAKSSLPTVASFYPELMTEPLDETDGGTIALEAFDHLHNLSRGMSVLAVGPGVSRNPETAVFVRKLVAKTDLPLVLDADGLNAFEGHAADLHGAKRLLVITPHPGEMARLCGCSIADVQKDRLATARNFAREHQLIVVLKGHRTLVAHPEGEIWVNPTGNPGMSTGGTGDILTGMTAGLLAQKAEGTSAEMFVAVLAAVYLHGLAGDVACESLGEQPLIATDLLPALPEAIRRIRHAANVPAVEIAG
jgi:NAD(P)H-hydrate epimerase